MRLPNDNQQANDPYKYTTYSHVNYEWSDVNFNNDSTNPINNILQLHYGYAYKSIIPRKAVVLSANVQLKTVQLFFITNCTKKKKTKS